MKRRNRGRHRDSILVELPWYAFGGVVQRVNAFWLTDADLPQPRPTA